MSCRKAPGGTTGLIVRGRRLRDTSGRRVSVSTLEMKDGGGTISGLRARGIVSPKYYPKPPTAGSVPAWPSCPPPSAIKKDPFSFLRAVHQEEANSGPHQPQAPWGNDVHRTRDGESSPFSWAPRDPLRSFPPSAIVLATWWMGRGAHSAT